MDGLESFFTDFKAFIMINDYFLWHCKLHRTGLLYKFVKATRHVVTCNLSQG